MIQWCALGRTHVHVQCYVKYFRRFGMFLHVNMLLLSVITFFLLYYYNFFFACNQLQYTASDSQAKWGELLGWFLVGFYSDDHHHGKGSVTYVFALSLEFKLSKTQKSF